MAIITFWNPSRHQTNQTSSVLASALQMAIDRNLRILIIDGTFNSDSIRKAFVPEEPKKSWFGFTVSNLGKVDLGAGIETLLSAVASNKTSPDIISNYTVPLLAGRLDVLYGMQTKERSVFERSVTNFKNMIEIANKYYDLVYLDIEKNLDENIIKEILNISNIVVYPFEQRVSQIEWLNDIWGKKEPFDKKNKIIPLLTREDRFSKYNSENLSRRLGIRPKLSSMTYNTLFMEAMQEGKLIQLFFELNKQSHTQRNKHFIRTIEELNELLLDRIKELQYEI